MLAALDDDREWPGAAARLLANLGFRLIEANRSGHDDSHLLIALRDRPTYRHFDPECIRYFERTAGRAAVARLDRAAAPRGHGRVLALWGHVHVLDRFPVENRFLTFGGDLRIATVDSKLTVVDLTSPAPIVRWGGHSQGTDGLAEAIGAFFGRLMVPVDFVPGVEELLDAVPAGVLYGAFLADAAMRWQHARRRGASPTELDAWLAAAWRRARGDEGLYAAGVQLLRDLGLSSPPNP